MLLSASIAEAVRHVGGDRSQRNRLAVAISSAGQTTLTFEFPLGPVVPSALLEVRSGDTEVVYVWSVNAADKTAVVGRAELGTTALTSVAIGSIVAIGPTWPRVEVRKAVTDEIQSLPGEGLFRMRSSVLTYNFTHEGFVTTAVTDMLSPYALEYTLSGRKKWLYDFRADQNLLRPINGSLPDNNEATLHYRAPFAAVTADSQDLATDLGLPSTAQDIPAMGAAYRLLLAKEAIRTDVTSQAHARKAEEVTARANVSLARDRKMQRDMRIADELMRLRQQWRPRFR